MRNGFNISYNQFTSFLFFYLLKTFPKGFFVPKKCWKKPKINGIFKLSHCSDLPYFQLQPCRFIFFIFIYFSCLSHDDISYNTFKSGPLSRISRLSSYYYEIKVLFFSNAKLQPNMFYVFVFLGPFPYVVQFCLCFSLFFTYPSEYMYFLCCYP